jgi:phospholipase/lecithinase/hemolysin
MFAKVVASPATYGFTKTIDATSAATAIGSTACGPNAIAQAAAGDSAASPSSLFCSVPSTSPSIAGTLRAVNADQTYMFADGVHPSAGMHKVFAQLIKDKMGLLLAAALGS